MGGCSRDWVRIEEISDTLYNKLTPSGCQALRICGLPKIHKPEVPLRAIVSCISSPTYQLVKYVARLISLLTRYTDSYVKNSRYFTQIMAEEKLELEELILSVDVTTCSLVSLWMRQWR